MEPFKSIVDTYARKLPDDITAERVDTSHLQLLESLSNEPISILFVDGAKSWQGLRHLLKTTANQLIPGHSLIVYQDYKYFSTFWIPVMMMRLSEYVQPVHNLLEGTTVAFKVIKPIESKRLEEFEETTSELNTLQTLEYLDKASRQMEILNDRTGAAHIYLGKVKFLTLQNHTDDALKLFKTIQSSWRRGMPVWQLIRVREFLYTTIGIPVNEPFKFKRWRVSDRIKKILFGS